jgi:two-component system, cell cycle sensor histidine kinase and response regulator CckA
MKILFISGYIDHASVQRELAAGMPFLQKPFTPEAFARKVRNVLDDSITTRLR